VARDDRGITDPGVNRDRLDSWMVAAFIEGKVWTSLAP
jgi:hypothetical protein